jgi:hypothetical protein
MEADGEAGLAGSRAWSSAVFSQHFLGAARTAEPDALSRLE